MSGQCKDVAMIKIQCRSVYVNKAFIVLAAQKYQTLSERVPIVEKKKGVTDNPVLVISRN